MIRFYIKGQEDPLFHHNWTYICDNYYNRLHCEFGPAVILSNLYEQDPNQPYICLYFLDGRLTGSGSWRGHSPDEYLRELRPSIENLTIMLLSPIDLLREAACEELKEMESETL